LGRLVRRRATDNPANRTLDKRRSTISCHLQVKTIWADSKRVALRLSPAEHLAKEPKPAFVYVLMFNDALEAVDSYLIHLRGKNLEPILKRLRKAQAASKPKINATEITYNPKTAGVRLPPNGKALRDKLEIDCGPDPQAYVASKAQELEHLGFEKGRYQLELTLQACNVDELVEAFLSLRPLEAKATESLEVRFGVALPANHLPLDVPMKLEIKPRPADQCTIRAYNQSGGPPAVFRGEVFFAAIKMPAGHFRARICTRFFTLDYQSGGKGQVAFATLPEVTSTSRFSLNDWRNYLRLLAAIGSEHTRLEVTPCKAKHFTIHMSRHIGEEQLADVQELLLACDDTNHVLELAGTNGGEFSFQDFVALAPEIRMASGRRASLLLDARGSVGIRPVRSSLCELGAAGECDPRLRSGGHHGRNRSRSAHLAPHRGGAAARIRDRRRFAGLSGLHCGLQKCNGLGECCCTGARKRRWREIAARNITSRPKVQPALRLHPLDLQIGGFLAQLRLVCVEGHLEVEGVDDVKHVALVDELVVDDPDFRDLPRHLGRDARDLHADAAVPRPGGGDVEPVLITPLQTTVPMPALTIPAPPGGDSFLHVDFIERLLPSDLCY
jgi:hypothetical protein